jgi:small subunit ribosomal protein S16
MIKIRLSRGGRKNNPVFRIVAIEQNRKREGKPLDIIGYWHPTKNIKKINKQKLAHWISLGAQKTQGVEKLLSKK